MTKTEINKAKFAAKNERRKAHRNTSGEGRYARQLRRNGVAITVRTTVPNSLVDGEELVYDEIVQGCPGAFGWAKKGSEDWAARIPGTSVAS